MSIPNLHSLVPLPPSGESPDLRDSTVYELARRTFFHRFARTVTQAGIDAEDAFQAVCVGLITRSRMASHWDPTRGALSTWLFVATRGIVLNMLDSHRLMLRRSGSPGLKQDAALSLEAMDVSGVADIAVPEREEVRVRKRTRKARS